MGTWEQDEGQTGQTEFGMSLSHIGRDVKTSVFQPSFYDHPLRSLLKYFFLITLLR